MRWLVRIFFALVLLAALLVGAVFLLPADKIAALASDQVKAATGRVLTLEGRIKPSVWPQIGIQAGPVAFSNAEWASDQPMLQAQTMRIGLDPAALLKGDIVIRELQVVQPQILLETSTDGKANWDFGPASSDAGSGAGGAPTAFTVDQAVIRDGAVRFIDRAGGADYAISALDLSLSVPAFNGPAKLSLSGMMNGQTAQASLALGNFGAALNGDLSTITLAADLAGADLRFEGRAGLEPLAAEGAVDLSTRNLAQVLALLGQSADVPAALGAVSAKGRITLAPAGTVHLRDGVIGFAGNTLSGALDVDPTGARPKLNGQLSTGVLDLVALAGGSGGGSAGGSSGWSTAPIDVSGLGAVDASIALSAQGVKLPDLTINTTRALLTLNDRRMVFDLRELRAYDGLVTGEFVVNGRGGLSVGGDLSLDGLALQAALSELASYEKLSGNGAAQLNFLASGNSQAALAQSLSGAGAISFDNGVFQGVDLAARYRQDQGQSGGRTVFNKITGTFNIADGVLSNQDFVLDGPALKVTGKGTVDIGQRKLNYRITPVAFDPNDQGRSLMVPLRVTGSWDTPKLKLDLEGALKDKVEEKREERKQELEEKREELKQEARDKIREKLLEKLGR